MKHYVLGFAFNSSESSILLVRKERPEWMKGYWNGFGGKIEENETPEQAIRRECQEEIGHNDFIFEHVGTFVCPGGTVYVFKAITPHASIHYMQREDELLETFPIISLPIPRMPNLAWWIPLCLAPIKKPVFIHENTLGV